MEQLFIFNRPTGFNTAKDLIRDNKHMALEDKKQQSKYTGPGFPDRQSLEYYLIQNIKSVAFGSLLIAGKTKEESFDDMLGRLINFIRKY